MANRRFDVEWKSVEQGVDTFIITRDLPDNWDSLDPHEKYKWLDWNATIATSNSSVIDKEWSDAKEVLYV